MLELMLYILVFVIIHLFSILLIFYGVRKIAFELSKQLSKKFGRENSFGFIHPNYLDVKVNEKVLWMTVKVLVEKYSNYQGMNKFVIFSHQENSKLIPANQFFKHFEIEAQNSMINFNIEIVKIKSLEYVNRFKSSSYLIQILLQTLVSLEILIKCPCYHIFDTTNLPFVYYVLKYFSKCRIICFYHCPYLESSVVNYVKMKKPFFERFNIFKKHYYNLIFKYYVKNGEMIDFLIFNSSITKLGILNIWKIRNYVTLNTPCNIQLYDEKDYYLNTTKPSSFKYSEQRGLQRENTIVSFSQFRPEKDHLMQIRIFQNVLEKSKLKDLKLNIIGFVKTEKDLEVYQYLNHVVKSLNLNKYISIEKDLSIDEIKQRFFTAKIGLHTQKDDISGATLIEMMSAGLIVVAHKSGAPLYDIIGNSEENCVGILANSNKFRNFRC
jgi:alpha-1,2-mannosyltransferase